MQSVDSNTVPVWRWVTVFSSLVILGVVLAWAFAAPTPPVPIWLRSGAPFVLAILLLAWCLWYPAAKYRHLSYHVDEIGITIHEGIVWRVQAAVARIRIQHTDVSQGPLQRRYGVATLKLYTAGSNFTRIELPGLSLEDAMALRDDLQRKQAGEGSSDGDAVNDTGGDDAI